MIYFSSKNEPIQWTENIIKAAYTKASKKVISYKKKATVFFTVFVL